MGDALLEVFTGLTADEATVERLLHSDPLSLGGAADRLRRERHGSDAVLTRIRLMEWSESPAPESHPDPLPGRTADVPDEVRLEGVPPAEAAALAEHLAAVSALHGGVPIRALRPCETVSIAAAADTSPEALLRDLAGAGLSTLAHPAAADPWQDTMAGLRAAHAAGLPIDAPLPWDRNSDASTLGACIGDLAALIEEGADLRSVVPLPGDDPAASPLDGTTGLTDLRVFAMARLLFPSVDHVIVEATAVGPKLGAVALSFGADSLSGAHTEPTARLRAKDAEKPRTFNGDRARALLAECGRTPVTPGS